MENKPSCKKILGLLGALLIISLASCTNLPQKVTPAPTNSDIVENSDEGFENESSQVQQVSWSSESEWTEPEFGPTVTPIILSIEKRGEEGALIVRPDEDEDTFEPDFSYDTSYDTPSEISYVPTALPGGLRDEMELYSFNPFNGSVVLPGQALHLDITLKNTGTTTWQTNYKIVDYSNMRMAAQKEFYLPYAVAPGGTVLISVYMTAPAGQGSYPENFWIEDAYGSKFGEFDYILTVGAFSSVTDIPTLPPTVTPTYYSPDGITATPDSLAWMCIDPERSKRQDCYQFCVEYSDREEFSYCFYDGQRYKTPVP